MELEIKQKQKSLIFYKEEEQFHNYYDSVLINYYLDDTVMPFFTKEINFYWLGAFTVNHVGGARGVMVIVKENGHGDTGSYPGRDWLPFP